MNNSKLGQFTTAELLDELIYRERYDNDFELIKETPTSYTFKFYKYT